MKRGRRWRNGERESESARRGEMKGTRVRERIVRN